ncbi:MAG: hypothetical protein QXQ91_01890 [Nanopusillaceae archaeon]
MGRCDGFGLESWQGIPGCNVVNTQDGRIDISCTTWCGRAIVKCADSRCLETLTCQSNNRCERVTGHSIFRPVFDYRNVGRSAILHYMDFAIHGNDCPRCMSFMNLRAFLGLSYTFRGIPHPPGSSVYHTALNAEVYRFPDKPAFHIKMTLNNWISSFFDVNYWFESPVVWNQASTYFIASVPFSPELFMEIDYDEYRRSGLRNVVGWTACARGKVGWNADDILRVLKEEFSNRPWALFDDRSMVLYTNLLSPESIVHIKDVTQAERVEIIREGHHVLRIDGVYDLREE